jgi:MarR family transcriptional regulator, 2-MHQ and catechol-resistance regulon repressor
MGTHFKGKPAEVRALDAYIKLMRATGAVRARLDRALARHKLTENQLGVLEAILHLGPQCQRALAEKLWTTGPSVTLLVDQLEERGWVRRVRSEEDRRLVSVNLTAEGRRFIERIFPGHAAAIVQTFGALSASEQEQLGRLCKKLGLRVSADESSC